MAIGPSAVANVNAHQVDGRHAVKYTSDLAKRKGKLMAFGATGYLPNNIILKASDAELIDGIDSTALATIAALQSSAGTVNEADNLVHWNQLFGVPPSDRRWAVRSRIHQHRRSSPRAATGTPAASTTIGLDVECALMRPPRWDSRSRRV